jgi:dolichol kinase
MDHWVFVENLYNTTFTLFFFVLMCLMYYIGVKGYRAKNSYGGISSILCGVCYLIFGYYNSVVGFLTYPYMGFMVWWIGMILVANLIFTTIIRKSMKKMRGETDTSEVEVKKDSILRRYIIKMTKENPYKDEIPFRMELIRKSFHLSGFLLLIAFFGFLALPPLTSLVNDGVITMIQQLEPSYNFIWGELSNYPFGFGEFQAVVEITMFALIGALAFAIVSDIIRIVWGPEYSIFNFLTKSMLRNKEKNAAGPQIYIITGFIFSYMLYMAGIIHIFVFFAGILIACLSDASAAIIGKKYGKHKVILRNEEVKSVEGFVAGVVVAYIIGFVFVGPVYALMGAFIFFLTDYLPAVTADNILNPIFIPIGIQFLVFLLGLPIGWF